jgi:hypothetical protein
MNNTDFFEVVSTDYTFRTLSIAIFVALVVLMFPLIYGILWFDKHGSDMERILSNMLVSSSCWTVIECGIFVQFPHIIRYIFGPLPQGLCFFLIIVQNAVVWDFFLILDAITMAKYTLIIIKNPSKFNNEFWHRFVIMWIKGYSFIFQASWHLLSSRQPIGYHICSGSNPSAVNNPPLKIRGVVEIFSFLLNIFVYGRIKWQKTDTSIGPQTHNFSLKLLSLADIEKMSLTTFVVTIFNILVFSIATLNNVLLNKLDPTLLIQYPYYIFIYYVFLISPTSITFFALLLYYCTNKPLQIAIKNDLFYSLLT